MIAAPEREGKKPGGGRIAIPSMFLASILWGGLIVAAWSYSEFSVAVTSAGGLEAWVGEVLADSAELTAAVDTDIAGEISE